MVKRVLLLGLFVTMLGSGRGWAQTVWTDGNADGLPDLDALNAGPGSVVTVDVWIDTASFNFTNYLTFVEWGANETLVNAEYLIQGGATFPIDTFSDPVAVGLGGYGLNGLAGTQLLGRVTFTLNDDGPWCVSPIVDSTRPSYAFSALGNGPSQALFQSMYGTCWEQSSQNGQSWGGFEGGSE
jgi:hypothetical protein